MSLEIFRIDENGAGWVDFSKATKDEKLNIEIGLLTNNVQMNCYWCHKPIDKGNSCELHQNNKGAIYFA